MVSALQDEIRGCEFPMTAEELARAYATRGSEGRPGLTESAGTRYLEVGRNKEGFWTGDEFCEQTSGGYHGLPRGDLPRKTARHGSPSLLWVRYEKQRDGGLYLSAMMSVKRAGAQEYTMRSAIATDRCLLSKW